MEWIGWYFEQRARALLFEGLGEGGDGPRYGNVAFDYDWNGVWDFKAHPSNGRAKWAYLNDASAVASCIHEHGHLGWVIAHGEASYDDSGEFKTWHDGLKGEQSPYVSDRIARGAPSRRRKVTFRLDDIKVIEFDSAEELDLAVRAGWLRRNLQVGQRNSGGSARAAKYGINLAAWRLSLPYGTA